MGTFNDTAEKLMDKLSDFADNKTEAKMLHLVNCVTMEVIAKVCCHNLFLQLPLQYPSSNQIKTVLVFSLVFLTTLRVHLGWI